MTQNRRTEAELDALQSAASSAREQAEEIKAQAEENRPFIERVSEALVGVRKRNGFSEGFEITMRRAN